jgi:hypothetical protein
MKSFLAVCALAALAARIVPAQAQTATAAVPPTREAVRAELLRARAAGELDFTLMPVLREPAAARGPGAASRTPHEPRLLAAPSAEATSRAATAARLAASR